MNWQQCSKMIFVGLSDSYEQYYQAVRRCWRFGQKKPVDVYIVISAREGCVKQNIERKQADCEKMRRAMLEQSREITKKRIAEYRDAFGRRYFCIAASLPVSYDRYSSDFTLELEEVDYKEGAV